MDHVFTLTSIIRNRKNRNVDTFCAFIDYQKAFDWVDKDLLLYKLLSQFRVKGRFYNAVKCLLLDSTARIKVNNCFTDWFNMKSGVRQGDTLSPTLFSMFINDLAVGMNNQSSGVEVGDT